jgi:hypothetical protein
MKQKSSKSPTWLLFERILWSNPAHSTVKTDLTFSKIPSKCQTDDVIPLAASLQSAVLWH